MARSERMDGRAAKQARNRRLIVAAAHDLFAERGFAATPVTVIASAAGVAAQTVFNHFPRKEEMFFDGRCVWLEIVDHLARHPDRHTSGPALVDLVSTLVAAHLERLEEPAARTALADLAGDPGLHLWERGLQQRAAQAIGTHIARHAPEAVAAAAQRCGALTVAEVAVVVEDRRRALLDQGASAPRTSAEQVHALLVDRLTDQHDLVVAQVLVSPAHRGPVP
ncbi:TetR/AcrR family transcriptional regulator [Klenkia brasiliensis]|uniref:TetR/AcrR family transcriptional regulator n=1 Tax=Klenkia brasiliensis TaxID=333142 RepID=UPI0013F5D407|nr:TetR/AcrR family transcriptional regulator [Klenkia brasiliensis]